MTSPLSATVESMRTHVATSRHAEMLFEILVDLLGDQGVLWTANEGRLRKLFRRDSLHATLIVPWPVAELSVGGRIGWVSSTFDVRTGEVVPEPELPPGKPSRLRGLGPAEVGVFDGPDHVHLVFGDDGSFRESSADDRLPSRLDEIPIALASKRAQPVELTVRRHSPEATPRVPSVNPPGARQPTDGPIPPDARPRRCPLLRRLRRAPRREPWRCPRPKPHEEARPARPADGR